MSDVEELVEEARQLVALILEQATGRLRASADVRVVQPIVYEAGERLEDVELYALIALDANIDAETAIKRQIARLHELQKALLDDQDP